MPAKLHIDDDDLTRVWADGMTLESIAARMGCHVNTVRNRARYLDLTPRGHDWARRPRQFVQSPPKPVSVAQPPKPRKPVAAVLPIDAPDPEIMAVLKRLGSDAKAIRYVASRFRLPYATVKALAARAAE